KDPKRRWQCAGDLRAAVDDVLSNPHGTAEDNTRSGRRILPWSIAIAALLLAAATTWLQFKPRELRPLLRANMDLGADAELLGAPPAMVLSPDAKVFGFVGKTGTEKPRMYIRRLDQLEATVLAGTENARNPFFSPDGQWIGFFAEGKLKKISING